jgi:hypothetical protein
LLPPEVLTQRVGDSVCWVGQERDGGDPRSPSPPTAVSRVRTDRLVALVWLTASALVRSACWQATTTNAPAACLRPRPEMR